MPERGQPPKLGRYDIVREIGRGAMGVVYEGRDAVIGRRVAIKTARRDVMESSGRAEELMQRFLREARAAGVINHPNVITIYDAGYEGDLAYIAMEYIESGTLRDLFSAKKSLSPQEVVRIGAGICSGLAAAHACGIVHRDIKPANIMILRDGSVKVADFGIAHVIDSNLTMEGCMIGTPSFMSPEQFGGQKIDHRSDLFSVGVILYELLTGGRPFTGDGICATMQQVLKTNPPYPSEVNSAVNPALSKVVMKALRKDPAERYESAAALAAALQESIKPNPDPAVLQTDITSIEGTLKMQSDVPTVPSRKIDIPGALPSSHTMFGASRRGHKRNWFAATAAIISLAILLGTSYYLLTTPEKPQEELQAAAPAPAVAQSVSPTPAATAKPAPTPVKPKKAKPPATTKASPATEKAPPAPAPEEPPPAEETPPAPDTEEPTATAEASPAPAPEEPAATAEASPAPAPEEPAATAEASPAPAPEEPAATAEASPAPAPEEPAAAADASPVPPAEEPPATAEASPAAPAPDGTRPSFSRIQPMVWLADTLDAYIMARDESLELKNRFVECRAGVAAITVKDAVTGEVVATAMPGDEFIELRKETGNIIITAIADGYDECTLPLLEAKEHGEKRVVDIVLKKVDLL